MKIFKNMAGLFFLSLKITPSYAVDENPVMRSIQNEEESRFFLIGVIAEGQSSNSKKGIAVIKDSVSGKTLTSKVGEKLLTGSEILLSKVERSKATLSNGAKTWVITYDQSAVSKEATPNELEENDAYAFVGEYPDHSDEEDEDESLGIRSNGEPGLFERWYSSLKSKENQISDIKISPNGELYQSRVNGEGAETVKALKAQVE